MVRLNMLGEAATTIQGALIILAATCAIGLAIGALRLRGFRLGSAGVLFSGLLMGHLGFKPDEGLLEFVREAGLVLFVYSVGLSVGPGFFSAFKASGLRLNLLAVAVVVLGAGLTLGLSGLAGLRGPETVGIFCGATTNTPSLAAATQWLREAPADAFAAASGSDGGAPEAAAEAGAPSDGAMKQRAEMLKAPGLAYAVTYPFGIVGVLLAMVGLRATFKVDVVKESRAIDDRSRGVSAGGMRRVGIKVTNRNVEGETLGRVLGMLRGQVSVSRVMRGEHVTLAVPDTALMSGDILAAVGDEEHLAELRMIVGEFSEVDPAAAPSDLTFRWLVVSRKRCIGSSVDELHLLERFGVRVTRVRRAEVELPPVDEVRLSPGDQLRAVGTMSAIEQAAKEVGDAPRRLEQTELVPIFIGIVLGVALGSVPLVVPGLPGSVRLGIAGGPLVVAMVLARVQRIGPLVWHMPKSAGLLLRDLGITLFLATVGLRAGDRFLETLVNGDGLLWLGIGAAVTVLPLLIVGALAMLLLKVRYLTLIGVLAGSMTDPPSLAFASSQAESEAPAIAYATVYPLSMILRIVAAQAMVMWLMG